VVLLGGKHKPGRGIVMGEFKIKVETNRIEFKQELNDKLEREVVSFLNYPEGGTTIGFRHGKNSKEI